MGQLQPGEQNCLLQKFFHVVICDFQTAQGDVQSFGTGPIEALVVGYDTDGL